MTITGPGSPDWTMAEVRLGTPDNRLSTRGRTHVSTPLGAEVPATYNPRFKAVAADSAAATATDRRSGVGSSVSDRAVGKGRTISNYKLWGPCEDLLAKPAAMRASDDRPAEIRVNAGSRPKRHHEVLSKALSFQSHWRFSHSTLLIELKCDRNHAK
jgi:hypothetical protein